MPLYIKDDAVARLARDLARQRQCTVTEVVRRALEREQRSAQESEAAVIDRIRAIQARVRREWQGPLTSNHDFLYDDDGNPIL